MIYESKEQAIELHREMWRRISEMNIREMKKYAKTLEAGNCSIKKKAVEDMGFDPCTIICHCFCCDYNNTHCKGKCKDCVIDWGYKKCTYEGSPYFHFKNCLKDGKYKEAKMFAQMISGLPARK